MRATILCPLSDEGDGRVVLIARPSSPLLHY